LLLASNLLGFSHVRDRFEWRRDERWRARSLWLSARRVKKNSGRILETWPAFGKKHREAGANFISIGLSGTNGASDSDRLKTNR